MNDLTVEEFALLLSGNRGRTGQVALYVLMAVVIVAVFALAAVAMWSYTHA